MCNQGKLNLIPVVVDPYPSLPFFFLVTCGLKEVKGGGIDYSSEPSYPVPLVWVLKPIINDHEILVYHGGMGMNIQIDRPVWCVI